MLSRLEHETIEDHHRDDATTTALNGEEPQTDYRHRLSSPHQNGSAWLGRRVTTVVSTRSGAACLRGVLPTVALYPAPNPSLPYGF